MKFSSSLTAGLASLGLLVAASADDAVKFTVPGITPSAPASQPAAPAAATPAPAAPAASAAAAPTAGTKKFTETQIAEAYGYFTGAEMGLRQLDFSKEQVEAMARGLVAVTVGTPPSFDPKEMGPEVQAFMAKKKQAFMLKVKSMQLAAGAEFFTKLKENKAVIESPSGLRYELLKAGTGAVPKPGQIVTVNLVGALITGQIFENTQERGGPADVLLAPLSPQNPEGIVAGLFEGIQKTGVGGKVRLYLPPSLAYGDEGAGGVIPPSATLIFEVEIVAVKDAPPPAPAPSK